MFFFERFPEFCNFTYTKEAERRLPLCRGMTDIEKIIHENEYVLKMQNEVLPYLERRVSEAWIPCAPENRGESSCVKISGR